MSKYKTLMSWDEFEEMFRPYADVWKEDEDGLVWVKYKGYYWFICPKKRERFGKEIEVKNVADVDYTHKGKGGWYYHKLWFKPYEFFKEEDFLI